MPNLLEIGFEGLMFFQDIFKKLTQKNKNNDNKKKVVDSEGKWDGNFKKNTPTALFQKDAAIISSDFRKKSTNRLTP